VTVTIPSDLEAYLEMQGAGYYPMLSFLDPERSSSRERRWSSPCPRRVAASLATAPACELDETQGDPARAHGRLHARADRGRGRRDLPDDGETRFYTINNTVKADASKTDTSGNSGFINVSRARPGDGVRSRPAGKAYGTVSTLVRAGHITAQILKPTPSCEARMTESSPQSRSRYQVITTLGQGGMARVLLTMSRGPAGVTKLLVVKELKGRAQGRPEFVTMFLDEARIAARLNHPNVIQTYEVSHDGAHPVIVMEYLEGQPLNLVLSRVGRKKMPLDLHLYILSQSAAGLHYAHELKDFDGTPLGLVHRDVSPQNVFVTYDGRVLIVDFGIAKAADSAGLTKAGVFKGKVGYAAPEQLAATGAIDRRADVFALGVMLWEAIAGKRLAQGEHELGVMNRRLQGEDPKIREVAPDAPEELCRICDKAMAHDPADGSPRRPSFAPRSTRYLETSKRVGAEEVGALVREVFAEDREKVRALDRGADQGRCRGQATTGERPAPGWASLRTPTSEVTPPRREGASPATPR
jgi:hypothetical protein